MKKPPVRSEALAEPLPADGIDPEAPLHLLLPKALFSSLFSFLLILGFFWLRFGEVAPLAWGFAGFFAALQILAIVGLSFRNRTEFHSRVPLRKDWLDRVAVGWLIACAFGAFLGWVCGAVAEMMFPAHARALAWAEVFFTMLLPIATMLPNLRYVGGKVAHVQIPLLAIVTLLPILVGLGALLRVLP